MFFKGAKMKDHKLSNQAVGAIMMALQKSLMEQTDIVPVLQEFQIQVDDSGQLVVMNPPMVKVEPPKSTVITDVDMKGPL
tara:strand:- start:54 stop:293 length:240 start_codon:yes stop_codon:yes gene_type:complete